MEAALLFEDAEKQFVSLLESKPLPVNDLLALINSVTVRNNKKDEEWTNIIVQELIEAGDFNGLYLVTKNCSDALLKNTGPAGIVNDLKRSCKDRMILAFIDTVSFASQPLEESFRQLDILLELSPGTQVIDKTWGFGTVRRLDNFYKRITIDFAGKRGHSLTFRTACETLEPAPQDHILTIRANKPDEITRMAKEDQGELVKTAIKSFGRMTVPKLESTLIGNKCIKNSEWKNFWDNARKKLRKDPLIIIPAKRTEFIEILAQPTSYDEKWFSALGEERDPQIILSSITELEDQKRIKDLSDSKISIINDRLGFALKGADSTDPALYVKLIILCRRNGFRPDVFSPQTSGKKAIQEPHDHLWQNSRFIRAAENLPVKDVANMVDFLLTEGDTAVTRLLEALPEMSYSLLNETLLALKENPAAASACRDILATTKAPPPLINWVFRYRKDLPACWDLPPLIELLHHAVITVETNLTGENLRMQNSLKKLFRSGKWLEEIFGELNEPHRQLMFERIQASPAWDPSTHRSLLARMLKLDPELEKRKRTITSDETEALRLTSWHSLAERQMQYKHLVETEMPKNSNDIAVARSYGDLRENFEYQAAKDYQRQLLQRQAELQFELETVRGTDFAGIPSEKAIPGTTVELKQENGETKTFTILGEWDSDETLNIISNKTTMAACLFGKQSGDSIVIPGPDGEVRAEIIAVRTLDERVRSWIASTPGKES
ncbi:MAG: GreA/GreB family elongation factor [Kiritimatiellia bacterium]